jgi:hypothetical protein
MKAPNTILFILLLIALPMTGVWIGGQDISSYLEFPPRTRYVGHAPFSWPVFIGLAMVILATMLPFLVQIARARRTVHRTVPTKTFPWWGWAALAWGSCFWILAWMRLPWFEAFQPYTFTPQWIGYIVLINAMTWRITGRCLLTHSTKYFLLLFPLSALFWWFFEYLNRFVQNWYYTTGTDFSPLQYFIAATLPFSTVLPAVLSTEELLATSPQNTAGLESFVPIRVERARSTAWIILCFSAAGLFFIGWLPDLLFPLLWVAPLLLILALNRTAGQPPFFPEVENGDWRRVYRLCLAALICGFFWELWNWQSLAKWIYSVPYVGRFLLFEMPVLGYSGYLPFGLECAVVADLLKRHIK